MTLSLGSTTLTWFGEISGTTLAGLKFGQLEFVNEPNVSTPIQGSSSVVKDHLTWFVTRSPVASTSFVAFLGFSLSLDTLID